MIVGTVCVCVRRPGTRRLQMELAQHALNSRRSRCHDSARNELQRATQLWARKFGAAAQDAKARAGRRRSWRRPRFSGEVIRQVAPASEQLLLDHVAADELMLKRATEPSTAPTGTGPGSACRRAARQVARLDPALYRSADGQRHPGRPPRQPEP